MTSQSRGDGSYGRPTGFLRSRRSLPTGGDYQQHTRKVLPMSPV
jgi:hypothetical protein